jgi:hypothetical protein
MFLFCQTARTAIEKMFVKQISVAASAWTSDILRANFVAIPRKRESGTEGTPFTFGTERLSDWRTTRPEKLRAT